MHVNMRNGFLLFFCFNTLLTALGQNLKPPNPDPPTRQEVARWKPIKMTASQDSLSRKFNSDSVASGYVLSGQFRRIVVLRFRYQTDLLEGIRKAVEQEGILNAVILTGMGSLVRHHAHSVANNTFPSQNEYFEADQPADIVSVSGFVIDGKVHAHFTFSTEEGAKGGHLEPNSRVFTFAGIALGVLDEKTNLKHLDNKNWR